ncbi:MAG: virulence factor SrfB, partial [Muribaculaceae bacterium]|nr:virulence factor SrfB [Muribaculaceae bacterium]
DDGSLAEDGFGIGAHYCRQSLMTLAFMEIVQQAQVQINSYDTRKHNGKILTPRVIEKIILTCPTAMSLLEQKALYQSLRDAVFVLNQFNLVNDATAHEAEIEVIPDVKVDEDGNRSWFYDEATCSQLVYLYGQFCERYRNCSDKFFELYGKKREVKGMLRDTIKIGSVDIGAGTTDVSVCQYEYNNANPSQIKPIPVFWDSFNTAGDDMLRVLISNVIIEGDNAILYKHMREKGWGKREIYSKLHHFFGKDSSMMSFADRMMRRDFNLQVNVPVMYRFLQLLSDEVHYGEFTFGEMFGDNLPNEQVMKAFADNFGFNLEEVVWTYDSQLLSKYVERSMDRLIESISTVLYAFDCDIVLLSGRPTNLAPIKRCFLKHFPVSPNRLVVMGRYRVGLWYPFRDESGFMRDTKSVVPVGAMIGYLASRAGGLNEFTLDLNQLGAGLKPTTDYFLKLNRITQEPCIITPEKSTGNVRANSFPLYIATKQYDLSMYPERPFYVIDINKEGIEQRLQIDGELDKHALQIEYTKYKEKLLGRSPFLFTLEREDMTENKENLEISTVVDREGEDVNINDFSLTVQSLNDPECYWLDSGEFELGIATKDLKTNNNA